MTEVEAQIYKLITTARRPLPAHFYSEGERGQCFGIDYELREDAEVAMAATAWGMLTLPSDLSYEDTYMVLRVGEGLMLASYLVVTPGGNGEKPELLVELMSDVNFEYSGVYQILLRAAVLNYLVFCFRFGRAMALDLPIALEITPVFKDDVADVETNEQFVERLRDAVELF